MKEEEVKVVVSVIRIGSDNSRSSYLGSSHDSVGNREGGRIFDQWRRIFDCKGEIH